MYFTKVAGRSLSPREAWERAPHHRADWFPAGPPAGVDQVDGATLAAAKAAGERALREGYGGVLPDGQAPCGTCVPCQVGRPQECRRPLSKAEARLRAGQTLDADRARASATVAELGALYVELSAGLD